METASCMLLLSTCGVFRTQTWSWGRRSSALSRRQIHATSNSGGSWSPLNLRNLWKRGFATTLGYVNKCSPSKYLSLELPGRWRVSLASPCSQGTYDVLGHMNLAKQSIVHGKHQKAPVGWTWGFCHFWEASRQQIPSCGSLLLSRRASAHGLSYGALVAFQSDHPLHAWLSLPVRLRHGAHHSQSRAWNFCVHLDKGLWCYASSGIFFESRCCPHPPPLLSWPYSGK